VGNIFHIISGAILLSVVHAAMPNHWLPIVAIGKSEKWNRKEILNVTAITSMAHTISSIAIGIVVGIIGYRLSSSYEIVTRIVAPLILVGLGIIYLVLDYRQNKKHHHHHHHQHIDVEKAKKKTKTGIVIALSFAMFFSPCIEIEAYFFVASAYGWLGITVVSFTYFVLTVTGMILLVNYASRGIEFLKLHFLEHHEKLISGIVLILLGVLAFVVV
jgi:putative Mn2+ efflux pump MntP